MKRRRLLELYPTIEKLSEFAATWKQWWVKMQPSWRGGESLIKILPTDADWEPVLRGGPNGLALVVLALSWWIHAANDDKILNVELRSAIDDVNWVLLELIDVVSKSHSDTGKRAFSPDPDTKGEPKGKK